jgi:hypothetical protein
MSLASVDSRYHNLQQYHTIHCMNLRVRSLSLKDKRDIYQTLYDHPSTLSEERFFPHHGLTLGEISSFMRINDPNVQKCRKTTEMKQQGKRPK